VAKYQYRAIDPQGKPIEGEMSVTDLSQLERQLQDRGLWLVHTMEAKPKSAARSVKKKGKVKLRDLIEFSTHMFTLLEVGIPLTQALKSLSVETPNLQLRATLQAIFQQVEAGNPMHEAMSQHPKIFPPQVTNLVHAGEDSGTLTETFKELERYLEWVDQIRGDVRQATIYPTIVIMAVIGLLVLLFTFVIPRFVPILEGLHVPLPIITVVVITMSEFILGTWWIWGFVAPCLSRGVVGGTKIFNRIFSLARSNSLATPVDGRNYSDVNAVEICSKLCGPLSSRHSGFAMPATMPRPGGQLCG